MTCTVHSFKVGAATVRIEPDLDSQHLNPCDRGDNNVIFATLERNSTLRPDWAREPIDLTDYAKEHGMWELPLYKYEHSGSIYKVSRTGNPFHCPWDSGRCGSVLLSKEEWKDEESAESYADAFVQEVTDWANGNVHGYIVDVPDEENADSCWGFIGDYDEKYLIECATEAAQAESDKYAERTARAQEASRPDMYPEVC